MTIVKTKFGRRSFLKTSAAAGGGLILGFNWLLTSCEVSPEEMMAMPEEWFDINSYLKIGDNGMVSIMSPNPEFGQNVITSMPMIVAEELDVDWEKVLVEQANYSTEKYGRQFTGGSQGIRSRWEPLRTVGASARHMLREAAAQAWEVPMEEVTTSSGMLYHEASGQSASYGEMASAAGELTPPEEVQLKAVKDFTIVGTPTKNVRGKEIVTGKPMFGIDYKKEGMMIAMVTHPPAFGMKLKSFDATAIKNMPGIKDVFAIKTYEDDYERAAFDTNTFPELVAIVGESTWQVMNAKKALKVEWEPIKTHTITVNGWGGKETVKIPAGLESTAEHKASMQEMAAKPAQTLRKDGDPEAAFRNAAKVIERTYSAPFLAHNCMEPINFYANVTEDKAALAGPIQIPSFMEPAISARLGLPPEKISIELTRMGGGFGRKAYGHYMIEAALISKQAGVPVKMMYTREDDATFGIYRPTYQSTYRAALDENNNLIAFHVKGGGIPEHPVFPNRFPAGAVDNYLAEGWAIPSNITIGAFRAPRSNFTAGAEQAFLDEVAEIAGKDPIQFRLDLLERAKTDPVGKNNEYDAVRYAGVLELVREKSGWDNSNAGEASRGVSAYFCHNTYVAQVLDMTIQDGKPVVENVHCAIDCGVVINPLGAINMAEGAIVDGIGNALYGSLTFKEGQAEKSNFNNYRMIRMNEAPKNIEVNFVKNEIDPTGMGEPPFPPIFGALANAMYKATGKRYYEQPFLGESQVLG